MLIPVLFHDQFPNVSELSLEGETGAAGRPATGPAAAGIFRRGRARVFVSDRTETPGLEGDSSKRCRFDGA